MAGVFRRSHGRRDGTHVIAPRQRVRRAGVIRAKVAPIVPRFPRAGTSALRPSLRRLHARGGTSVIKLK
ncbi:hypothetical protein [Oceanicella actignis]|uniref:hypothetical protein n=1 Tax=Oceanicella actignis TaxID=1189325 RepID=UPI000932B7E8|nr:hypothetical protein [Oceanicella actignis]